MVVFCIKEKYIFRTYSRYDYNKMMSKDMEDKYKDNYKHGYDKMKYDKMHK